MYVCRIYKILGKIKYYYTYLDISNRYRNSNVCNQKSLYINRMSKL